MGNALDLHSHAVKQVCDLHGGSRRTRLFEEVAIDLVHASKIGEVLEVNGCLEDLGHVGTSFLHDSPEILEGQPGLGLDVIPGYLSLLIGSSLTRDEE